MSAAIVTAPGVVQQPPELSPRNVVSVEDQPRGQLVHFDCEHVVWFAIRVKEGDRYYCSVCFEHFYNAIKSWQARANLAAISAGGNVADLRASKPESSSGEKPDVERRGIASDLDPETTAGVSVPGAPALNTAADPTIADDFPSYGIAAALYALESGEA